MFPWLVHLVGKGRRLSDIEYLAIKEFDGKLVHNDGNVTAAGDVCTLTASGGKDMYLGRARIMVTAEVSAAAPGTAIVSLLLNGVVIESTRVEVIAAAQTSNAGAAGSSSQDFTFALSGAKVAAGEIIKIEATTVDANVSVYGMIVCFEETTGASPAV